jgi:hypothetical protein
MAPKLSKLAKATATAMKRPAGAQPAPAAKKWHDGSETAGDPKYVAALSVNVEDSESAEEGTIDDRRTSRAQRWIFEAHIKEFPKEVQDRYKSMKDTGSKQPGKVKERNKLVNAYIPRHAEWTDKPSPKSSTVEELMEHFIEHKDEDKSVGLSKTIMLASIFHGNRQLFDEAVENQELLEDEETGNWHFQQKTKSRSESSKKGTTGRKVYEVEGANFAKAMGALMDLNIRTEEPWMKYQLKAKSKAVKNSMATEADYAILQESFDGVTRVTTSIRKVAMEMLKMAGGDAGEAGQDMARKGVEHCKLVVASQTLVEDLLMTPREQVNSVQVAECLRAAAKPYRQLVCFYNELVAMHSHYNKSNKKTGGAASSAQGSKFKALAM